MIEHQISLRLLENYDLDFLYKIENNTDNFSQISNFNNYSKQELKSYINNAKADISVFNQIRFVIQFKDIQVGLIDLFDYCPISKNAGVGVIVEEKFRNKKFASRALELLISYSFKKLDLLFLFANINSENYSSKKLFENFGFIKQQNDFYKLSK